MKNPGIYVLTNTVDGMQYVGKDSNLPSRVRGHLSGNSPNCRAVHDAIQEYGRDSFSVEIIRYPGISEEALSTVERWWIQRLQTLVPKGYNLTEGGEGGSLSEETRQKMSKIAAKRVVDGTHNFLDRELARRTQKKRIEEGTHNFLGGEIQRRTTQKRVEEGTHHLLGGEIQRRTVKKQLEEGTHNFLDSDFQRQVQKKRIEEGTHHFLSGEIQRRTNKKRIEEGTHHFLGGEVSRRTNKKRIEEGIHHWLGDSNPAKRLSKEGRHPQTLKRIKGEWCYIIALSRFWYEIHDYTLKRRAEFLSKDIPDMSNAEQTYLF